MLGADCLVAALPQLQPPLLPAVLPVTVVPVAEEVGRLVAARLRAEQDLGVFINPSFFEDIFVRDFLGCIFL